jgi:hypothetical protein
MPIKNSSLKAVREALRKLEASKTAQKIKSDLEALASNPDVRKIAEDLRRISRPRGQQPKPEPEPKHTHKHHKPHHQYQRERVRAILDQTPNWRELPNNDLVALVRKALPKEMGISDKRKTILRAAGRLSD